MLSALKYSQTKSTGAKYVMFDLEDTTGIIRSIAWPEQYTDYGHLVEADAVLVVRGTVDRRPGSDEANLIVNEIIPLDQLAGRFTRGIRIRLDEQRHAERGLADLYEILRGYPGNCELQLVLTLADGSRVYMKSDSLGVELTGEMRSRVEALLGPGNLKLIAAPIAKSPPRRTNGAPRALVER